MWSSSCERGCVEQGIWRTVPFRYPRYEMSHVNGKVAARECVWIEVLLFIHSRS
jgi:hypothetical protein